MNDQAYRRRLERDLPAWVEQGLLGPEAARSILARLPAAAPRLSAASALGLAGAALLGIAAIAFVMANWDGLPRFGRTSLVVVLVAATIGGAVWADGRRPQMQGALLLIAALIFAAGAGLIGQMFNIPGEPWGVFAAAALAALALSAASDKAAPGLAAAGFTAFAYLSGWSIAGFGPPGLLTLGTLAVAAVALRQRKPPLGHAAIWLSAFTLLMLVVRIFPQKSEHAAPMLILVAVWAAVGAAARIAGARPGARTLYGYGALFGVAAFWAWGFAGDIGLAFHAAAIVIGLGLVALGRMDQHGWVLATGLVGTVAGIAAALMDLGLDLMVAAGLFLLLAVGALVGAFMLARTRTAGGST